MGRRLDWSRVKWENRYISAPKPLGISGPPKNRPRLPALEVPHRFHIEDRVYAREFGNGKVVGLSVSGRVKVRFKHHGTKQIHHKELKEGHRFGIIAEYGVANRKKVYRVLPKKKKQKSRKPPSSKGR